MKEHIMIRRQGFRAKFKSRQQGAVAMIVAISLVVLIGMLGLVLDLGHLYVTKTELQNAADAAALSGAKQLDKTASGICCGSNSAVYKANETAAMNYYDFASNSKKVIISNENIQFSSSPDGPWVDYVSAQTNPADKSFIKIDTGSDSQNTEIINTWFMHIFTGVSSSLRTRGIAVAGRYVVNLTPIAVCAIDPDTRGGIRTVNGTNELTEFGFRRGIAYNIPELNPLGAPRDPILINPVAIPGGAVSCQGNQGSANFVGPFICSGTSAAIPASFPGRVYVNTGYSAGPVERAFNSRFEAPAAGTGSSPCDIEAVPDTNKKQYDHTVEAGLNGPRDWMDPDPTQQTISLVSGTRTVSADYPNINPSLGFGAYGVLWTYSRAVRAVGSSPNATAGLAYAPGDWTNLYPGGAAPSYPTTVSIPPYPVGTLPAPYNNYVTSPTLLPPGKRERRVLNVAIIDCNGYTGGGVCDSTLPMIGIGKFFMPNQADLNGNPKKLAGEFAGLIDPSLIDTEVKLYK
jgi:hypothetical protein